MHLHILLIAMVSGHAWSFFFQVPHKTSRLHQRSMNRVSYTECNLGPGDRQDCGYFGITEGECDLRECCWSGDPLPGSPACYHSIPTTGKQCLVEAKDKVECGWDKIRKEQCLAKECCWQPSMNGPWCYKVRRVPVYTGKCGKPAVTPKTATWRVIGGDEAIPHSWPWIVSLQRDGQHMCGGSIINNRWILSAAHCEDAFTINSPDSLVVFGAHNVNKNESSTVKITMDKLISHEDFAMYEIPDKGFSVQNDVLLIRLTEPIEFNDFISPVCVTESEPVANKRCYSMGWGLDTFSVQDYMMTSPDLLQQFMSPVIDSQVCNSTGWYNGRVHPSSMCAGWEEGGRGNCFGDSGGPLVCHGGGVWEQVGIVSWGEPCALARYPTVYAEVSQHVEWIEQQLAKYDGNQNKHFSQ